MAISETTIDAPPFRHKGLYRRRSSIKWFG
jgi:hypothetical protein